MRILLIIVVLLATLGVGLLFLAPSLIDAEDYRAEIEAAASEAVGQPVQINGALTFSVLPTPRLVARNLIVSPPTGLSDLPPLLKADTLQMRFSLRALLQGRREIRRIVLIDPLVNLHTDLADHRNFGSVTTAGQGFELLEVQNGHAIYDNLRADRQVEITGIDGTIERNVRNNVLTGQFSGTWLQDAEPVSGGFSFRLGTGRRPALSVEGQAESIGSIAFNGRLEDSEAWATTGQLNVGLNDLRALLPAALGIEGTIKPLPLKVRGDASIAVNGLEMPQIAGSLGASEFSGRLALRGEERLHAETAISFEQLDAESFVPDLRRIAERLIDGVPMADQGDQLILDSTLNIGLISHNDQFVRQLALNTRYQDGVVAVERASALMPGGSDVAFAGDIRLTGGAFRLSGSVEMASDNLASFLDWSGVDMPEGEHGRLRNLSLSAGLDVNSDVAQITAIDLRVDQTRVTGGAAIALLKRPSFSLNLTADKVNSNAYQAMFGVDGFQWSDIFGDPQSPRMQFLDRFDTNTALRIRRLILASSVVNDMALDVGLLRGVLDIKKFAIQDIDGASLNLSGRIDTPAAPQILLRGELISATPAALFSGASPLFTPMTRLSDMKVEFGLEGGLKRLAAEMDVSTNELSGHVGGLFSDFLDQPLVDLDIGLSGDNAVRVVNAVLPGWRPPFDLFGPVLMEGVIKGDADAISLQGKLDVMAARLDFQGRVAAGLGRDGSERYDLDLRLRHGDTIELMQGLWPAFQPQAVEKMPMDAALHLSGDATGFVFDRIDGRFGANRIRGEARLALEGSRPAVVAELTDVVFDTQGFRASGAYGAQAASSADDRSIRWSRLPLDLDWLDLADIAAQVNFRQFTLDGLKMNDGAFTFDLSDRALQITDLSARLGDGSLSGGGALTPDPVPTLSLQVTGQDIQLPALLQPLLAPKVTVDGQISFELNARGRGVTPFDMVRDLEGELIVSEAMVNDYGLAGRAVIIKGAMRPSPPITVTQGTAAGRLVGKADLSRWQAELELRPEAEDSAWPRQRLTGPLYDLVPVSQ